MYDYLTAKKIGLHILRGIMVKRHLRLTVSRQEEVAHDAAVRLFERCTRWGIDPERYLWGIMRNEITHQLWNRETKRRDHDTLDECVPIPEATDNLPARGYWPRYMEIVEMARMSSTLKKFYRKAGEVLEHDWMRLHAVELRELWESVCQTDS